MQAGRILRRAEEADRARRGMLEMAERLVRWEQDAAKLDASGERDRKAAALAEGRAEEVGREAAQDILEEEEAKWAPRHPDSSGWNAGTLRPRARNKGASSTSRRGRPPPIGGRRPAGGRRLAAPPVRPAPAAGQTRGQTKWSDAARSADKTGVKRPLPAERCRAQRSWAQAQGRLGNPRARVVHWSVLDTARHSSLSKDRRRRVLQVP